MGKGEVTRASSLAKRVAKKKARSDAETSSESDVEKATAAEASKSRAKELKRKVTEILEDNAALDRQLAEAEAKKQAKLAQLAALSNSYPVN